MLDFATKFDYIPLKAIEGVQPGLEEIEEGTEFGCVGEGEQIQIEAEPGLEDIHEDGQFECGGEVDKEVGAGNGLGQHEVEDDSEGRKENVDVCEEEEEDDTYVDDVLLEEDTESETWEQIQIEAEPGLEDIHEDGQFECGGEVDKEVGAGNGLGQHEVEDGSEGRKENVDVCEEEEEDDTYVDDVLLEEDTESETCSDEGLIDVSIECEVHSDMEDEWVGDIECEVENVSQQDAECAKTKDRKKPQRSSRKNVKHQQIVYWK
ncbi:hypothetical protein DEO72_LG5g463 [Vigna unguiculata]|uniref:Uncharacterized protein n=1 Tax=Vigna unguiculata TaxID=3917 RepID=A0A4D6LVE4_VIGUN|nr:hypothetical protein DEO72_LG5g463 [Vigna unguiculata]